VSTNSRVVVKGIGNTNNNDVTVTITT